MVKASSKDSQVSKSTTCVYLWASEALDLKPEISTSKYPETVFLTGKHRHVHIVY